MSPSFGSAGGSLDCKSSSGMIEDVGSTERSERYERRSMCRQHRERSKASRRRTLEMRCAVEGTSVRVFVSQSASQSVFPSVSAYVLVFIRTYVRAYVATYVLMYMRIRVSTQEFTTVRAGSCRQGSPRTIPVGATPLPGSWWNRATSWSVCVVTHFFLGATLGEDRRLRSGSALSSAVR